MSTEITDKTFCANHPNRETRLCCNKCGKYICVKCARRVATGYRCPECLNQQQQIYETAFWYDYISTAIVSAVLTFLGGLIIPKLGFFMIFIAPLAGGVIAEVIFRIINKRRSKYIVWSAIGGITVGGLALCIIPVIFFLLSLLDPRGGWSLNDLISLAWILGYLFLCGSTLYYRLRGIRIN